MNRLTRIICTIGPNSLNREVLLGMQSNGLNVVRLNGSHATLDWHKKAIELINEVLPTIPILLDIPGRKIRTLQLKHEPTFSIGDILVLTTDISYDGHRKVPVNYSSLHSDLSIGNVIMADDGTLRFTVVKIEGFDIYCSAETAGQLKSRKGINVPFVNLNTPQVTLRDEEMIEFAVNNKIDYIGLSFVESAKNINAFKELIAGRGPRIIAKIENQGGINNAIEIVELADGIMIDRGDLSVETTLYDLAIKQKKIISIARKFGKPVIVATEMLHTMIQNSFPTKAEVTDIANAVLDGCSATMLSGETAVGPYALESVRTMCEVINATERYLHSNAVLPCDDIADTAIPDAISASIPNLCTSVPITKIVAITRSGYAAKMIAKYRLPQPIFAVSDDPLALRGFNLIAGTIGVLADISFSKTSTDHIASSLKLLWDKGLILNCDQILVTGICYPSPGARMNTIQIHKVEDLMKTFGWVS